MTWYVSITGDGVTYRHGHRRELSHLEPLDDGPSPKLAARLAEAFAAGGGLGGDHPVVAGWLAVRWLVEVEGAPRWDGPAFLFSFEAPEGGEPKLEATGTDASDWPLPS